MIIVEFYLDKPETKYKYEYVYSVIYIYILYKETKNTFVFIIGMYSITRYKFINKIYLL